VAFLTQSTESKDVWVLDSGCSSHMSNSKAGLVNAVETYSEILTAKADEKLSAKLQGDIEFDDCLLKDVLYVPDITKNLLSVNKITENGGTVKFSQQEVEIIKEDTVIKGRKDSNGLYCLKLDCAESSMFSENSQLSVIELWHKKLGHMSYENMKKLIPMSFGMETLKITSNIAKCETCIISKQRRTSFGKTRTKATRPLELIHTDVCGPLCSTRDGYRYFTTFLDDFTHFLMVFFN